MSSLHYSSKVDQKARLLAAEKLKSHFEKLVKAIIDGEEPKLIIPKRTLSNTIFDSKRKLLLLGSEVFERRFLDVHEARKFMQTLLMGKIIYEALINNEYPTIRDLYYRGKHTIRYKSYKGRIEEENTWDEQKESDSVLRDIEVYADLLREDMLILSKEKGKVVGDMRIRSGDDVIDLSKMGHGAYA
ncbi:MAG: DNA topoisomerase VI, partial [Ignisphaera sp.]